MQTRGFNAFSYADIARVMGVTTASLHYHFPTKADLGQRVIERYTDVFANDLDRIDASVTCPRARLDGYIDLYYRSMDEGRMCLSGMLAADCLTLPEPMRLALTDLFDVNERWLAGVLDQGRASGDFHFHGDPVEVGRLLVAALEGGMLVARAYGQPARFQDIAGRMLATLTDPAAVPTPAD